MLGPVSDPTPRIDLWIVNLDRWGERGLDAATLDAGDHAQASRLRDAVVGRRMMARRSVARWLLADYLDADPSTVTIERTCPTCHATDHGRPSVVGAAIEFSISSSHGIGVVAISDRPVGVDVEVVRSGLDPVVFALSDDERRGVLAIPPDQRGMAFLRLWTAKEAVLKAAGRSLADDLVVDVPGLVSEDRTTTIADGRGWEVRQLPIDPHVGVPAVVALADLWGAEVSVTHLDGPQPTPEPRATA